MNKNSISTTRCSTHRHREFVLVFDTSIPQGDVVVLASFLEESVEKGVRYEHGEIISFGSMLLRVAALDDSFTLQEPDTQSVLIAWRLGVTQSMMLLRLQKDITESVGLVDEMDAPSIGSSLLVGTDIPQGGDEFILERANPMGADSGWFVGCPDTLVNYNDESNLMRISVYQAILNWPRIAPFLALPPGCRIDLLRANTLFTRSGSPLEIKPRSLVEAFTKQNTSHPANSSQQ